LNRSLVPQIMVPISFETENPIRGVGGHGCAGFSLDVLNQPQSGLS
jgi:hypothetical protein